VRGSGTYLGFDTFNAKVADSLHLWLNKSGIHVARTGPTSFGLRPALILGPKHAANLREALRAFDVNHSSYDQNY